MIYILLFVTYIILENITGKARKKKVSFAKLKLKQRMKRRITAIPQDSHFRSNNGPFECTNNLAVPKEYVGARGDWRIW